MRHKNAVFFYSQQYFKASTKWKNSELNIINQNFIFGSHSFGSHDLGNVDLISSRIVKCI